MRVNKLLAAVALPAVALGSLVALGGTASARPAPHPAVAAPVGLVGSVKAVPSVNLVDGQKIKLIVTGMGSTPKGLFAGQCDSRAAAGAQDQTYCDKSTTDGTNDPSLTNGQGTMTLTVHTGKNFHAPHPGANCSYSAAGHQCIVVVTDDPVSPTKATFAILHFKNPATATATTVKASKKKAKAKTNLTFTARTTHKGKVAPTGKVTFFDNGKKFAVVKETKTGVVKAKHRILVGKNKITAVYGGDVNNKASKSKAVVVVGTKAKK